MQIMAFHKMPHTLNEYIAALNNNRYAGAAIKKGWTVYFCNLAREQLKPVKKPIFIKFLWYSKSKRRDPDNIAFCKKFILDGMKEAGIIKQDNLVNILGFEDQFQVTPEREGGTVTLLESIYNL